jgi:CRP-like cAMP-binding protein
MITERRLHDHAASSPLDPLRALDALHDELREGPQPDLTMRLKLADLLLAGGREDEAIGAFRGLADELAAAGLMTRAFGVLKRVESLRPDDPSVAERLESLAVEQQRLFNEASEPELFVEGEAAPPPRVGATPTPRGLLTEVLSEIDTLLEEAEPAPARPLADSVDAVADRTLPPHRAQVAARGEQVLDLVQETLRRPPPPRPQQPRDTLGRRLLAAPLFSKLGREELSDVVRRLRFNAYQPGDILVTEGEQGQNLSILASGRLKVFVRSPTGRDVQVATLDEGDFFGEVSAISGSRRTATLITVGPCETLELRKEDLDDIAQAHPHIRNSLDDAFVERVGSSVAAVVRAIDITAQGHVHEQADLALATRFGRSFWDPRMRLRLASTLIRAGHEDEALPILAEAASVLLRAGRTAAAAVLLKKIEGFHYRDVVEIHLAPLRRALAERGDDLDPRPASASRPPDTAFQRWLIHVARDSIGRSGSASTSPGCITPERRALEHFGPGLRASPLFESLADDELLVLVNSLRLLGVEAGGVVLTEGEQGESLMVLVSGAVKIWVRDAKGHNVRICQLEEGSFFGEIATLSGRPRTATVTAAERCILLEVNRDSLAAIRKQHPHVGQVLEEQFLKRVGPPRAH